VDELWKSDDSIFFIHLNMSIICIILDILRVYTNIPLVIYIYNILYIRLNYIRIRIVDWYLINVIILLCLIQTRVICDGNGKVAEIIVLSIIIYNGDILIYLYTSFTYELRLLQCTIYVKNGSKMTN